MLDEQVPSANLVGIFESLSLKARDTKDVDALVDAALARPGPAIVEPYVTDGVLNVITLEPTLEHRMLEAMRPATRPGHRLDPVSAQQVMATVADLSTQAVNSGSAPCWCAHRRSAGAAPHARAGTADAAGRLYSEVDGGGDVHAVGVVGLPQAVGVR